MYYLRRFAIVFFVAFVSNVESVRIGRAAAARAAVSLAPRVVATQFDGNNSTSMKVNEQMVATSPNSASVATPIKNGVNMLGEKANESLSAPELAALHAGNGFDFDGVSACYLAETPHRVEKAEDNKRKVRLTSSVSIVEDAKDVAAKQKKDTIPFYVSQGHVGSFPRPAEPKQTNKYIPEAATTAAVNAQFRAIAEQKKRVEEQRRTEEDIHRKLFAGAHVMTSFPFPEKKENKAAKANMTDKKPQRLDEKLASEAHVMSFPVSFASGGDSDFQSCSLERELAYLFEEIPALEKFAHKDVNSKLRQDPFNTSGFSGDARDAATQSRRIRPKKSMIATSPASPETAEFLIDDTEEEKKIRDAKVMLGHIAFGGVPLFVSSFDPSGGDSDDITPMGKDELVRVMREVCATILDRFKKRMGFEVINEGQENAVPEVDEEATATGSSTTKKNEDRK